MGRGKNIILENITIEAVASEGKCIARHEGQVIFVEQVVPGDIVDLLVFRKKKGFMEARTIKFHTLSPKRVEPFCSHFGTCGGCKWQSLPYDEQLKFKWQQVKDNLERIAKVPLPEINPILGSPDTQYYRNKLEFTFSNHRWLTDEEIQSGADLEKNALGFHVPKRFDRIVDIDTCYLQGDPSNAIRTLVREETMKAGYPFYDILTHEGWLRNLIIRTASTGQLMVILQVAYKNEDLNSLLGKIKEAFPQITSLMYVINSKGNDTFQDLEVELFHGQDHIMEEMDGLHFKVGPKSFYQTNSKQAERLYKVAIDMARIKEHELVYDLYTGTGTLAQFAARSAAKVVGLEYVEPAIEDAWINAKLNNLENVHFQAGDIKDLLTEEFMERHGRPQVIITDPPRAGMHTDVTDALYHFGAERIVYVSCNPATQARDIQLLAERYKVVEVQPVDMFPHTHHVENVVLLERRD
jgi:23S rRNA (uracil1939-C5)-methyltransferase